MGFEYNLLNYLAPVLALAVFVRENPSVPYIEKRFQLVANDLLALSRVRGRRR